MDEWYEDRRIRGICVRCGKKLDKYDKHSRCPECRKIMAEENAKKKAEKDSYRIASFHANEKLDADAKAAAEQNLSYGQYKMKQYLESMKRGS